MFIVLQAITCLKLSSLKDVTIGNQKRTFYPASAAQKTSMYPHFIFFIKKSGNVLVG